MEAPNPASLGALAGRATALPERDVVRLYRTFNAGAARLPRGEPSA